MDRVHRREVRRAKRARSREFRTMMSGKLLTKKQAHINRTKNNEKMMEKRYKFDRENPLRKE